MSFHPAPGQTIPLEHSSWRDNRPESWLIAVGIWLIILLWVLPPAESSVKENRVFQQFTQHIDRQIQRDKQGFAQANHCVSWFYKAKKKPLPPARGISWNVSPSSRPEADCLRDYPGGINDARNDLAKIQALLSVSLTFYEFALVADQNDDASYSPVEIVDLFRSLSLSYDDGDPTQKLVKALTERFDAWYHKRNMDDLMHGMNDLYERGYRVTPSDRVELNRVMG